MTCTICGAPIFFSEMVEMHLHHNYNDLKGHELDYDHDAELSDDNDENEDEDRWQHDGHPDELRGDDLDYIAWGGHEPDSDLFT